MSVKELLTDSWSNMLKNNFILKCILVGLAAILINILFIIVMILPFLVNPILGIIVAILCIVFYVPVSIATSKVLLDVFQGRDAKIFGFVGYGFKNAKKLWAIIGRTILKLLPLYLIKLVLFVVLVAYIGSSVVSIYNEVKEEISGEKSLVYSAETIDSLTSDTVDSLTSAADSLEESIEDSLDSTLNNYDFSNYSLEGYDFSDITSSDDYNYLSDSPTATSSPEDLNALLNALDQNEVKEFVTNIWNQYGSQILKFLGVICLYFVVAFVIDILIIMKRLYYTVSYYLAFEDDNVTSRDAIEQSEELMRGNRGKFFWTQVLIGLIYSIVVSLISAIPASTAVALLSIIVAALYSVYLISYQFTFFKKLIGDNSSDVPATEPYVAETPVVETPVSDPTVTETPVEEPHNNDETDSTEE